MKVSQSQLKTYKACRRLYYLKYVEGLEYARDIDALKDGSTYHNKLEQIYDKGYFDLTGDKTDAMALAYEKFIYTQFKVNKAEQWFEYNIADSKHQLIGRVDAIAEDGLIVEHKTTSGDVSEEYVYSLQWDEQILCYMLALGVREMYYTICKKPTIRQKQTETAEDYLQRCCDWYSEDTDKKIRVVKITRTDEEIKSFEKQLKETVDEMESCKLFYNNTANCNCYGRKCVYSQLCLNYDAKVDYIDFKKTKKETKQNDLF